MSDRGDLGTFRSVDFSGVRWSALESGTNFGNVDALTTLLDQVLAWSAALAALRETAAAA
jgi:hypothetical protein